MGCQAGPNRTALGLCLLLALAGCKRREPRLPPTPYPKAKLAYRVGNCVFMDLTHSGEPEKGRCFGLAGEPMLAHDFDGNGTADLAVWRAGVLLIDSANDGGSHETALDLGDVSGASQLVVADFTGTADHRQAAAVAVRRGHRLHLVGAPPASAERSFGDGEGEYFAGRWQPQAPARLGVRHGECVDLDLDGDDQPDRRLCYPDLGAIDQVLVGDWNGDGRDDLLLRRGPCVFVDSRLDGTHPEQQCFGEGKGATDYFAGSWDGH